MQLTNHVAVEEGKVARKREVFQHSQGAHSNQAADRAF